MKKTLAAVLVAGAAIYGGSDAEAGELSAVLDLSVRWGATGFTLDGRVDGPDGPRSGRVNGRLQRGGVALDGWFDDRGRTRTFEIDANVLDGLFRAVVRGTPERI